MNEKFFALAPEKQHRIINAGLKVFSRYDYKHASTDMIAQEANISKGLLFHYFGSKKEFYLYLYDYSMKYMMDLLSELHDYEETDLFKIISNAQLMKIAILHEHPDMGQFTIRGYREQDNEVEASVSKSFQAISDASLGRLITRVDRSKFKESITAEQALNIVMWLSEGFVKDMSPEEFDDVEQANQRFLDYMDILRRHFYREEYL